MKYISLKVIFSSLLFSISNFTLALNCEDQNFANLHYDFYRNAFMPGHDSHDNYRYYPGSGYFTGETNINTLISSESAADGYFFQWANRCHDIDESHCGATPIISDYKGNAKGNLPVYRHQGVEYRFFFSTHLKANMCTIAQAYRLAGSGDTAIQNLADAWDFTALFTDTQLTNHLATNNKFEDICYIYGVDVSQHVKGIVLDYEVQDNRSANTTTGFLQRYKNYLHDKGLKAILWTNPPGGVGWTKSGFTGGVGGNAQSVFEIMDQVALSVNYKNTPPVVNQDVTTILYNQSRLYTPSNKVYNQLASRQRFYVIIGLGGFYT